MSNIKTPVDDDRFAKEIGAELTNVAVGYAKAEMTVTERHLNGLGMGGMAARFLPSATWPLPRPATPTGFRPWP